MPSRLNLPYRELQPVCVLLLQVETRMLPQYFYKGGWYMGRQLASLFMQLTDKSLHLRRMAM